ncbi:substrate-binding periplasmic protein [Marinobacter sp. 1Y8]
MNLDSEVGWNVCKVVLQKVREVGLTASGRRLPGCLMVGALAFLPCFAYGDVSNSDTRTVVSETVNYLVVEDRSRPFQVVVNGQSVGGIISDMVDAIFRGSRYSVKHQVYPVNRLRQVVADDKVAGWIAYEAVQWHTFGNRGLMIEEPLFETHHVMLTCRKDIPDPLTSLADLKGMKILTLRNFSYPELGKAALAEGIKELPIDRFDAGIDLVRMGRADGFVEMQSRLSYHVAEAISEESKVTCLRLIDFSRIIPDYPIYLSVDMRWSKGFRDFVAQRIRELRQSGELAGIQRRYLRGTELNRSPGTEFSTQ